ncbi:hypothetical protein ACFP3T_10230 [Lactiplantibacillus dongliensis]|uniref:Uncharacterized protein n=1 Tax=Lactiplantibacillus dongliensis TaxID=2559919 RepID=A0ABW1R8A0_9LACO|nr:hypothetical protein [Lactiplantibacillus dongliensis]
MARKVANRKKPHGMVKNNTGSGLVEKLFIDFNHYPNWTHAYVGRKFTNALSNEHEAAQHFFFLINEFFGDIEANIKPILANNQRHCHRLTDVERELALKVIGKLHPNVKLDEESNIWQLAAKRSSGIRVIGVIVTEQLYYFYPLFIDHHHLLLPSKKYNQRDYKKYNFLPQESW